MRRNFSLAAFLFTVAILPATSTFLHAAPATPAPKPAEPLSIKGKIDAVTVYRGQALVTRVIDLPDSTGLTEIVVSDLPDRLLSNSLFAEPANVEATSVRSISYRERAVSQDVREEVRVLDAQIRALSDKIAGNSKSREVLAEQRAYLDKLANFTAPTASVEMTKGVLNAETLKTLTTYQFDSRSKIATEELRLQQEARDLQEQVNVVARQKNEITGRSSKTVREAVIFINQEKAGGQLRLRYLVDSANWAPSYNIRADAARKTATVEYQASIQQMSGEDWNGVQMTLSTATPSLVAAAPQLNQLTLFLASRTSADVVSGEALSGKYDYSQAKRGLDEQRRQFESQRALTANNSINPQGQQQGGNFAPNFNQAVANSFDFNRDNDDSLNKVADQLQVLELLAKDGKKEVEDRRTVSKEGIVVSYDFKNRTSLPSRADQQLIQIAAMPVKSQFYKVAIPVLTNYVYDEATLTNNGNTVLLAGPVASYVGGQFVGSGAINTVAVGQTFTVGFGIDSSLRATRERTEKTETTQGGNKIINYTYKISIENFGTSAAEVRLLDRLPVPARENEVKVNFTDAEGFPLSKDADYQQFDRKRGILRWDITVPAQKNGAEAFSLVYKMNMEYDKNLGISASAGVRLQEMQQSIEAYDKALRQR